MDEDEYAQICALSEYPAGGLSVTEEVFSVIKRQQEHRRFRAALRGHRQDKTLKKYVARHGREEGESLAAIARSVDLAPCMLARLLLEAQHGWNKTTISNLFKSVLELSEDGESQEERQRLGGVSEREYARLRREVAECIESDAYCSPLADRVRHNVGLEYEFILIKKLRNRQLVFESEDMLRAKGLSKTPDVRLLVPIGVYDQQHVLHVVNWIDSKAMFGDRHTHESENASQLQGYVNRYGPGMVIYWFGHVANLSADRDVFITHEFPAAIELPGGPHESAHDAILTQKATLPLRSVSTQTAYDGDWTPVTTCTL